MCIIQIYPNRVLFFVPPPPPWYVFCHVISPFSHPLINSYVNQYCERVCLYWFNFLNVNIKINPNTLYKLIHTYTYIVLFVVEMRVRIFKQKKNEENLVVNKCYRQSIHMTNSQFNNFILFKCKYFTNRRGVWCANSLMSLCVYLLTFIFRFCLLLRVASYITWSSPRANCV